MVFPIVTLLMLRCEHLHAHVTADDYLENVQKFYATPALRAGGVGRMVGLLCSEATKLLLETKVVGFGF